MKDIISILNQCSRFYKQANIETDMAKRIMYSIIPAVMSVPEQHSSAIDPAYWATDYKALRSAANGAKDLIKYGTLSCARELYYYQRDDMNVSWKVRNRAEVGSYIEALDIATKAFLDERHWNAGYGGKLWARIADTLKQLEEKRLHVEQIRKDAQNSRGDTSQFYKQEVLAMKEMIVLMNVFDGLAHNSGSIMPKVIGEEAEDIGLDHVGEVPTKDRVERMMDAKELNDPFAVYREVEHIIGRPEFRASFGDWISRIRQRPEYNTPQNADARQSNIIKVRLNKATSEYVAVLEDRISKLSELKDKIINTRDVMSKERLIDVDFVKAAFALHIGFTDLNDAILELNQSMQYGAEFKEALTSLSYKVYNASKRIRAIGTDAHDRPNFNDNDVISAVREAKTLVGQIENAINDLLT